LKVNKKDYSNSSKVRFLYCISGEKSPIGWDFEQHSLVEGVPSCGREVGTR